LSPHWESNLGAADAETGCAAEDAGVQDLRDKRARVSAAWLVAACGSAVADQVSYRKVSYMKDQAGTRAARPSETEMPPLVDEMLSVLLSKLPRGIEGAAYQVTSARWSLSAACPRALSVLLGQDDRTFNSHDGRHGPSSSPGGARNSGEEVASDSDAPKPMAGSAAGSALDCGASLFGRPSSARSILEGRSRRRGHHPCGQRPRIQLDPHWGLLLFKFLPPGSAKRPAKPRKGSHCPP